MEGRDNKGKFIPGNSLGSGKTRTKGIATHINEKTHNLKDIVDQLYLLFMSKSISVANRIKIAEYFTSYAVGKPIQFQHLEVDMPEPIQFIIGDDEKS